MQSADKVHVGDRNKHRKLIGSYLIEANLITEDDLFRALEKQKISQARIGDILVGQGSIKPKTLDYFVDKIVKPEQSRSLHQHEIFGDFNQARTDNSIQSFDLTNKILNLNAIALSPIKVFTLLFAVVFLLVLAGLLVNFNSNFIEQSASIDYAARLFRLDEENNIPTLYSGLALGFCSILLFIISRIKKQTKSKFAKHWQALSLIFIYLAVDELVSIHEIFNSFREIINAEGALYYAWVIPGIALVIVFLLVFNRFIQSLPKKTKSLFILAGALYVGGAIGAEMIGAHYLDVYGEGNLIYSLVSTLEEFLEMFGILIFIYALLAYIGRYLEKVNLQVNFVADKKFSKSGEN